MILVILDENTQFIKRMILPGTLKGKAETQS